MDNLYNELIELLDKLTNQKGKNFTMGKFEGIGWIDNLYSSNTHNGIYPMISLRKYDKTVNMYVMNWNESNVININNYIEVFGSSSIGKSCIRIKKLSESRIAAIKEIVETTINNIK